MQLDLTNQSAGIESEAFGETASTNDRAIRATELGMCLRCPSFRIVLRKKKLLYNIFRSSFFADSMLTELVIWTKLHLVVLVDKKFQIGYGLDTDTKLFRIIRQFRMISKNTKLANKTTTEENK